MTLREATRIGLKRQGATDEEIARVEAEADRALDPTIGDTMVTQEWAEKMWAEMEAQTNTLKEIARTRGKLAAAKAIFVEQTAIERAFENRAKKN